MLKLKILHPEILMALGSNGHGARILIADGNFPVSTCTSPVCKKVFLNLSPGLLTVTEILKVIVMHVPVEQATLMVPPDGRILPQHEEYKRLLGGEVPVEHEKRTGFYDLARSQDTCLAIASGDMRKFANILLTIGTESLPM